MNALVLTIAEAAEWLGIGKRSVYKLVNAKRLKRVDFPGGGLCGVSVFSVLDYVGAPESAFSGAISHALAQARNSAEPSSSAARGVAVPASVEAPRLTLPAPVARARGQRGSGAEDWYARAVAQARGKLAQPRKVASHEA